MHRYYKITRQWAEKLGETRTAVLHPDGMYLVLPNIGLRVAEILHRENGGARLLPAEALQAIGAIGLTVAEAQASARGELRHDTEVSADTEDSGSDENGALPDNPENNIENG